MGTKDLVKKIEGRFMEVIEATGSQLNWIEESAFAIQALDSNPQLMKCDKNSLFTAVYNVALTGLTLNPKLAYCYLVPRGGKAVLDVSYQGLNYIMTNQLDVKSIHAEVVYENDDFDYYVDSKGVNLHHRPSKFFDRGEKMGVYAVAYLNDGGCVVALLSKEEVEKIKNTSQAASSKYSPWTTFPDEMWKKTAVRRLWKLIPKTDRMENAAEAINVIDENFEPKFKKKHKEEKSYDNMFEEQPFNEVETEEDGDAINEAEGKASV